MIGRSVNWNYPGTVGTKCRNRWNRAPDRRGNRARNIHLEGYSFGKIAAGLEKQGTLSPTGKGKWNREAISKLLSNEKYTSSLFLDELNSMPAHLQPKRQTLSFRMDKLGIENYKTKE